jgi:YHS domain-containing protein/thiol-disulfide isomerase/thioredoxin
LFRDLRIGFRIFDLAGSEMIAKHFAALTISLAALSGAAVALAAAPPTGILWQTDLEAAKRIAAQTNRLVLVHFWQPNCGPCKQLEKDVFSQPQVQQEIQSRFVPVKLNADEWPTTLKTYGINRYPTDLVITPSGQIVGRMTSPLKPDAYLQQLAIAASGTGPAATPGASAYVASMAGISTPQTAITGAPIIQPGTQMTPGPAAPIGAQTSAAWGAAQPGAVQQPSVVSAAPAMPNYSGDRYAEFFQKYGGGANQPAATAPQTAPPVAVSQTIPPAANSATTNAGSGSMIPPLGATPQLSTAVQPQVSLPPVGQTASMPAQAAPQTSSLAAPPPLGLEGFCPVTLAEQKRWQVGDRRWGVIHRGRTYLFAGPTEQQKFLSSPDRYSPAGSGQDVVMALDYGQSVDGTRALGTEYQSRIYLFSSQASQSAFWKNPERYAAQVLQAENPAQTTLR